MSGNCCSRISGSRTRPPAKPDSLRPWKRKQTCQKPGEVFAGRRRIGLNPSERRPRTLQTSHSNGRITLSLRVRQNRAENNRTPLSRISSMARRKGLHKRRPSRASASQNTSSIPDHVPCPVKEAGDLFFFQAEDGIRDKLVTGVQTCALPISPDRHGHGAGVDPRPVPLEDPPGGRPRLYRERRLPL